MKVLVNGQIEELICKDYKTGVDLAGDIVLGTGDPDFRYNDEQGIYECPEEAFNWWEKVLASIERVENADVPDELDEDVAFQIKLIKDIYERDIETLYQKLEKLYEENGFLNKD